MSDFAVYIFFSVGILVVFAFALLITGDDMQNPKFILKSKVFWFNAITLAIAVATVLTDPVLITDPSVIKIAAAVVTVGNIALRMVTEVPVSIMPTKPEDPKVE